MNSITKSFMKGKEDNDREMPPLNSPRVKRNTSLNLK
jgi:hypothetical protein